MNHRQRILTALNNSEPDRVPIFELLIDSTILIKIAELLSGASSVTKNKENMSPGKMIELYCFIIEELQIDATNSGISMGLERTGKNEVGDKYGIVYTLSKHGIPLPKEGPIKDASDVKGFDMRHKLAYDDFVFLRKIIKLLGKGRAHFVGISCPFKISWHLRGGMQNLLLDYIQNPRLVHDLARIATDYSIACVDMALEVGADVFIVVGDLASEHTLIISPEHFREYIKPYYKTIVDYVHHRGAKVIKHTDGNMWPILDDFVEIGFDGIHPVQPQSMDIAEVKEHLAGKMCILGNIDCRNLLPFGTKEQVEESVRETIQKVAPGGGYIISSSNSIHPACRPENYVAMIQATHRYGRYGR